jgi:N-acetylmuramate 1-kinase
MTGNRSALTDRFLAKAGWGDAARRDLAGDASTRRYVRLCRASGEGAILMDAPPDSNTDIRPFVTIARHLRDIGLSAPRIYEQDAPSGFLLLEDLGDDLFARVIPGAPDLEHPLYETATDVLIDLPRTQAPPLTWLSPQMMAEQASLVFDAWVRPISGPCKPDLPARFRDRFQELLELSIQGDPVMILRDYHAENLLWLPQRSGLARVGLLDFQDAMLAHPAYDLVSLLQDVRRDVSGHIEQVMIARYIEKTGQTDHDFRAAYAVLGVQRNLRILAVFARLSNALGKPYYATLIHRPWAHIMRGLGHPALSPIAAMLRDALPHPTPANLQKLTAP